MSKLNTPTLFKAFENYAMLQMNGIEDAPTSITCEEEISRVNAYN